MLCNSSPPVSPQSFTQREPCYANSDFLVGRGEEGGGAVNHSSALWFAESRQTAREASSALTRIY